MVEENPWGCLPNMFFTVFLFFFGASAFLFFGGATEVQSPSAVEPIVGEPVMRSLTVIENVEVIVLESYPMQIHLQVAGYQPDGCDAPVQVEQRRDDNHVYVEIYRSLDPNVMCPMNIAQYSKNIPLEGGFESGAYIIDVNGYVVEITL